MYNEEDDYGYDYDLEGTSRGGMFSRNRNNQRQASPQRPSHNHNSRPRGGSLFANRADQNPIGLFKQPFNTRSHANAYFNAFSKEVQESLRRGTSRIVEYNYFIIKPIGQAIKFILAEDSKTLGIKNFDKNMLPPGEPAVLSRIGLYVSDNLTSGATASDIMYASYKPVANSSGVFVRGFESAELNIWVNSKKIIADLPGSTFNTLPTEINRGQAGIHVLDNPRLIPDQQRIEATLEFASQDAISTGNEYRYVKLVLIGARVTPV